MREATAVVPVASTARVDNIGQGNPMSHLGSLASSLMPHRFPRQRSRQRGMATKATDFGGRPDAGLLCLDVGGGQEKEVVASEKVLI